MREILEAIRENSESEEIPVKIDEANENMNEFEKMLEKGLGTLRMR